MVHTTTERKTSLSHPNTHSDVLAFVHRYILYERYKFILEKFNLERKQIDIYFIINERALEIIKSEIVKTYEKKNVFQSHYLLLISS